MARLFQRLIRILSKGHQHRHADLKIEQLPIRAHSGGRYMKAHARLRIDAACRQRIDLPRAIGEGAGKHQRPAAVWLLDVEVQRVDVRIHAGTEAHMVNCHLWQREVQVRTPLWRPERVIAARGGARIVVQRVDGGVPGHAQCRVGIGYRR